MSGLTTEPVTPTLSTVTVELVPVGTASFPMAVIDVFEPGELTVTCSDPEFDLRYGPLRVFRPGTWREATMRDADGDVMATFYGPR
jgi:hypothetical protein